jgi:hypothetical protein
MERIDQRIKPYVNALQKAGIDTNWSCEGHPPSTKYPTGFDKPTKAKLHQHQ